MAMPVGVLLALTGAVLQPVVHVGAVRAATLDARDYLPTSEEVGLPLAYGEMERVVMTSGDVHFAPDLDAFEARVIDERWEVFETHSGDAQDAIVMASGADAAAFLVDASFYRADPLDCWAEDPPEALSIAGVIFRDSEDEFDYGEIVALDLFSSGDDAQRFVEGVVSILRTDPATPWIWFDPGTDEPRSVLLNQLECLGFDQTFTSNREDIEPCSSLANCWEDAADYYVIARRGPWVVRVHGPDDDRRFDLLAMTFARLPM